jgi:16S rRNA (guanine966-N2)-methyltransferase
VRPTAEDVRLALMELLEPALCGARIADLFAGTGALGLEALSRGARQCDFVENGPAALHALKANVAALRVRARTRIFVRDAIPFADRLPAGAYDIVFADPPYGSRKLDRIVEQWLRVPFSTLLALEHSPEHVVPVGRSGDSATERGRPEAARVSSRQRRIRDTMVTVLRRQESSQRGGVGGTA